MKKKSDNIIFQVDEESRQAARILKQKYALNISAFLRQSLVRKLKELELEDK